MSLAIFAVKSSLFCGHPCAVPEYLPRPFLVLMNGQSRSIYHSQILKSDTLWSLSFYLLCMAYLSPYFLFRAMQYAMIKHSAFKLRQLMAGNFQLKRRLPGFSNTRANIFKLLARFSILRCIFNHGDR